MKTEQELRSHLKTLKVELRLAQGKLRISQDDCTQVLEDKCAKLAKVVHDCEQSLWVMRGRP
jgi:hypothetical protein